MTSLEPDPGSFRDRESRVFVRGGRIHRALSAAALADWERLAATRFFADLTGRGSLPRTERVAMTESELLSLSPRFVAALEHETLPFVSYPYEWSFSMLRDAALLTLDVLAAALAEGMTLKDASAYNVQFRAAQPVFVDIGSFETWREGEPWSDTASSVSSSSIHSCSKRTRAFPSSTGCAGRSMASNRGRWRG